MRINDFDTTEQTTRTSQDKDELRTFEAKHSLQSSRRSFYEFFAGGGMVRAGLGEAWDCLFANDIDAKKAQSYIANFGSDEFWRGDVRDISLDQLSGSADLAWASFPCQDLSLAGKRAGLDGDRSQAFWSFWDHMLKLRADGRAPKLIALENVTGAVSSRGGADFTAMMNALAGGGYRFGAIVVDAAHFLPHSRQRLFLIAVRDDIDIDPHCVAEGSNPLWHPQYLCDTQKRLDPALQDRWIWWHLPKPARRHSKLADFLEAEIPTAFWREPDATKSLIETMNETNVQKLLDAANSDQDEVGIVSKRTRYDGPNGTRVVRAEIRFDGVSGCLCPPKGGASKQILLFVESWNLRSRHLTPRETARLMGLPEEYRLPEHNYDAYFLTGDGVAVPVVRYLSEHIFERILGVNSAVGDCAPEQAA